jgi:hypothetical protein
VISPPYTFRCRLLLDICAMLRTFNF